MGGKRLYSNSAKIRRTLTMSAVTACTSVSADLQLSYFIKMSILYDLYLLCCYSLSS
jgi:hypothetical protein